MGPTVATGSDNSGKLEVGYRYVDAGPAPEPRFGALHRRGLRYLVDTAPPGTNRRRLVDVLRGAKVALFADGCFWHSCPEQGQLPKVNREWWEHEDPEQVADRVVELAAARLKPPPA